MTLILTLIYSKNLDVASVDANGMSIQTVVDISKSKKVTGLTVEVQELVSFTIYMFIYKNDFKMVVNIS